MSSYVANKEIPVNAKSNRRGATLMGLLLLVALLGSAWASSEKVLYRFHGKDGRGGGSVVLDSRGALYGATVYGGSACPGLGCGVVFQLTRDAKGKWHETVLHDFAGTDGDNPVGSLVADKAGNLYGTTAYGGANGCTGLGCGVAFELVKGKGGSWTYAILHYFTGQEGDGLWPYAGMIFDSQGNLYGTTSGGGNYSACSNEGGCGVVFELTPDGKGSWAETVVYAFDGSDGGGPDGKLTFDSLGNLYGTTYYGGAHQSGTVFKLTPGKQGQWTENVLHSFSYGTKDGDAPFNGVVFDTAGNLYGTTPSGGMNGPQGWGTAFKLTPESGGKWRETILHAFDRAKFGGGDVSSEPVLDPEGNFYGTAEWGGSYDCPDGGGFGCGVVFKLTPRAKGKWKETVLHSFGKGRDGAAPGSFARDPAGHLFGTTGAGGYVGGTCGQDGCGVVFEVSR